MNNQELKGILPINKPFVEALRKNNVKFEYHVFPDGCHGLGLGTKETATKGGKHYQPEVYEWTKLFEQWMNRMA